MPESGSCPVERGAKTTPVYHRQRRSAFFEGLEIRYSRQPASASKGEVPTGRGPTTRPDSPSERPFSPSAVPPLLEIPHLLDLLPEASTGAIRAPYGERMLPAFRRRRSSPLRRSARGSSRQRGPPGCFESSAASGCERSRGSRQAPMSGSFEQRKSRFSARERSTLAPRGTDSSPRIHTQEVEPLL